MTTLYVKRAALGILCLLSFLTLLGDINPVNTIPLCRFIFIKAVALAAFVYTLQALGFLNIKDIYSKED